MEKTKNVSIALWVAAAMLSKDIAAHIGKQYNQEQFMLQKLCGFFAFRLDFPAAVE